MIDADRAERYGVPTKALNQAVRRNSERFPVDFAFPLSKSEKDEVVTNCDHLRRPRFSPVLPNAFTEHGAIMAANLLGSPRAVEMNAHAVRAFVRLREMIASHKDFVKRLDELEERYDQQLKVVFDAIRQLMTPPTATPKRKIAFV